MNDEEMEALKAAKLKILEALADTNMWQAVGVGQLAAAYATLVNSEIEASTPRLTNAAASYLIPQVN